MEHRGLLLAYPSHWNERVWPYQTEDRSSAGLRSRYVACEASVGEKCQHTIISGISHPAHLNILLSPVQVGDKAMQPPVTSLVPFCDTPSDCVDSPIEIESVDTCYVQRFEDNSRSDWR